MVRAEITEEVKNLAGGKGTCFLKHVVTEEELFGHGRMYAKVVVPPGCSVGWHQHVTDTEPYYILKGEGVFIDHDRSETVVHPGDVCLIEVGQWHSMENRSDEDLEFMALIYNKQGYLSDH